MWSAALERHIPAYDFARTLFLVSLYLPFVLRTYILSCYPAYLTLLLTVTHLHWAAERGLAIPARWMFVILVQIPIPKRFARRYMICLTRICASLPTYAPHL